MIRPVTRRVLTLIAAAVSLAATPAFAQLEPTKLYNGVNRPLLVKVAAPKDADAEKLVVQLIEPETDRVTATAQVKPGETDLAALFPQLWTDERPRVVYAQLGQRKSHGTPDNTDEVRSSTTPRPDVVERIGPAVVLQPMLSPARASLDKTKDGKPLVTFPKEKQPTINAYTGIRAYVDKVVRLDTDAGEIVFRLRPDVAPNTTWNIRQLVAGGFYDDVEFHRVVPVGRNGKGFVIQTGDPTATGEGTPGYEIQYEASLLPHEFGVVSMARDDDPNTNGCQFFIALSREETSRLDGLYTSFGQVLDGPGVQTIRTIAAGNLLPGKADRPEHPVKIKTATLVDASPIGAGPKPVKIEQPGR